MGSFAPQTLTWLCPGHFVKGVLLLWKTLFPTLLFHWLRNSSAWLHYKFQNGLATLYPEVACSLLLLHYNRHESIGVRSTGLCTAHLQCARFCHNISRVAKSRTQVHDSKWSCTMWRWRKWLPTKCKEAFTWTKKSISGFRWGRHGHPPPGLTNTLYTVHIYCELYFTIFAI